MLTGFHEWHWEITKKCNLECKHCVTDCGPRHIEEMSVDDMRRALKTMLNLGCRRLMITGGEPFILHKKLMDILEECHNNGVKVQILTNGYFIGDALAKKLAKIVESMSVSLDGSRSEVNDPIRGQGSFEKAHKAIRLLKQYIPVSVYLTVSKANLNDVKNTIGLARSLGAVNIHVSEIKMSGRALINRELFELADIQKLHLQKLARDLTANLSEPLENCNADLSVVYLSSKGMVFPCAELSLDNQRSLIGNINSAELEQKILESKKNFAGGLELNCCYQVYLSENLSFYLDKKTACPLVRKEEVSQ